METKKKFSRVVVLETKSRWDARPRFLIALGIVGATFLWFSTAWIVPRLAYDGLPTNAGELGDMFGGTTSLFSALGFIGVVWNLILQRRLIVDAQINNARAFDPVFGFKLDARTGNYCGFIIENFGGPIVNVKPYGAVTDSHLIKVLDGSVLAKDHPSRLKIEVTHEDFLSAAKGDALQFGLTYRIAGTGRVQNAVFSFSLRLGENHRIEECPTLVDIERVSGTVYGD